MVEDDDERFPTFLRESHLGKKRADRVVNAIKEVIGRLPPPNTDQEMPKEKELDGSVEGQMAKAGRKKSAMRKRLRTPSPVPSTSKKLFDTQKEDNGLVRNSRGQRQRKPSKKLRGSD